MKGPVKSTPTTWLPHPTIEPAGASYHDPYTGAEIESGAAADIRVPGRPDFREFTAVFQDGLNLRDGGGNLLPDPSGHPPDSGEPAEPRAAKNSVQDGLGLIVGVVPDGHNEHADPPAHALEE